MTRRLRFLLEAELERRREALLLELARKASSSASLPRPSNFVAVRESGPGTNRRFATVHQVGGYWR